MNFSLNAGERVGLVGRNGHGKTTLLRIIIGDVRGGDRFRRGLPDHEHGETWMAEKILSGLGFTRRDMARPWHEFSGG